MQELKFSQIEKDNKVQYEELIKLWIPFINELDEHCGKHTDITVIENQVQKRVNIQGMRNDMHFEICYCNGVPIGFANFAVDLGGIKGLLDAGYGFIMGFYISPEYRRQGYGRTMVNHIQDVFKSHGVKYMYTSPDPVTGEPFWSAMGFEDSGKMDPDDKLPIYIKSV